jgi:glyoxylase-like metal-dependent hydrolase (beta-lactamase superfamily II)
MMIEEVRPDLFRIIVPLPDSPLKFLNSYVVRSAGRNLVIDTGLNRDECFAVMKAGLGELKIDPDKTDFFITHLHADHFGLVKRLIAGSSRVYFNRPDAEIIEAWPGWDPMLAYAPRTVSEAPSSTSHRAAPRIKFSSEWCPSSRSSRTGTSSVGDYHFQCVQTPASLGHTCLYEPEKKILVAGDHILIDITPTFSAGPKMNPEELLWQPDRVHALDVALALPGTPADLDHRAESPA